MERNYWLHRIRGGDNALPFAHPLLFEHNILSIGWSDFSEDEFAAQVKKEGIAAIDRRMSAEGWGMPRNRWNLFRFICEMKQGDIVVVPMWNTFNVFEITSDAVMTNESIDKSLLVDWNAQSATYRGDVYYYNAEGNAVDLGFYREVKPIVKDIPRNAYADSQLYMRMKIRQTNANINDLKDSVDHAILSFQSSKPINIKNEFVEDAAPNLLNKISKLATDQKLEQIVEDFLKSIGARVDTPSKNESATENGDADKVAYFDNIKVAIMVQVKKHQGITHEWAVEQIKAFKNNHDYGDYDTHMWVISTCDDFSADAKKMSQEHGVRLINGIEFCKMLLDAGLEGLTL